MAEVVVHIYDVTNSGSEIDRFYKDGIGPIGGVFHSAIQVYGDDEWSYGCCEQGTGVFSCLSTKNSMYTYREKIALGRTDCTIFMVDQILRELTREWSEHTYDLLSKNCNHFCDVLCNRLGVPKLPGWVNRFAHDGGTALEVAVDTTMRVKQAKTEILSTSKVANRFLSDVSSDITNSYNCPPKRSGTLNNSDNGNMKMQGTWKMVAKRSRSSTKRAKKQVARSQDFETEYKSATSTSAEGDSGSEKLGVSVLGQHFAEKVDHVPIKKRRFMVPAPSPLNRSFARGEDSQHRAPINLSLPVSRLNPNLIGGKTSKVSDDKPDCGSHDFFGIKILAEVACSSGMSSDISSAVGGQLVEHVRQKDALTFSPNDSSTSTVNVSGKDTTIESSYKGGEDTSKIVVPQNALVDILGDASAADQSEDHSMVAAQNINIAVSNESSTEKPKENMETVDSGNLASKRETITVSENLSGDERIRKGKKSECLTDDRLHWDLNLPTDAWGQSCDVDDEISRRYSDGEITESITESRHVDGSKDYPTGLIASEVRMNSQLLSEPSAEESVRNGKECQSGYDSQFEDGELREPYPWEEIEGDSEDVEQVDYGSEPENERFYSLADESNDNKLEDIEKKILAETKCGTVKCKSSDVHEGNNDVEKHVVVCMNNSHSKGSSPSRSFRSKQFSESFSHESIRRRKPDSYEELSGRDAGPNKFVGRERTEMRMQNRSPRRRQFSGWDSRPRFSPPIYKGGEYRFGRQTVVEDRVMMSGFDQPGPSPGSHYRHFSNGGYRGRFRRLSDGNGNRDFRDANRSFHPGDANDYPSRMHINRMNGRRERSNSPPVFRRLHDPQSRSRSRSRSPVSWNGRNRSPQGFRGDENRMERVRFPFQKRFPLNQETGFMLQQRNLRNSRFFEGRNNDGGWENHHKNLRGRMFRSEQRFDNMRRVNSENNFRPLLRYNNNNNNRRFDDGGGSRGGGCKYKGAEEKNENMYEMVRRPQTMEEDGGGFRVDEEQLDTLVSSDNKKNNEAVTNK